MYLRHVASAVVGSAVLCFGCTPDHAQSSSAAPVVREAAEHDEHDQKIEMKDVPPVVLDSVKQSMPNAKITEAEKEIQKGKTVYSFDVVDGAKKYDVDVAEDGKILKTEEDKD